MLVEPVIDRFDSEHACLDLEHPGFEREHPGLDRERDGGIRVDPDGDLLLQPEPVRDRVA
jgi:hypothetical protein